MDRHKRIAQQKGAFRISSEAGFYVLTGDRTTRFLLRQGKHIFAIGLQFFGWMWVWAGLSGFVFGAVAQGPVFSWPWVAGGVLGLVWIKLGRSIGTKVIH